MSYLGSTPAGLRPLALLLPWLVASSSAPAAEPAPLPWVGGETVEVELRTVPFYAVDERGEPVLDLTASEVELRYGGKPLAFTTFDRFPETGEPEITTAGPQRGAAPGRHVFLLFDLAFTSPNGVLHAQQAASDLVDRLPATDRIYLLTHHSQSGFREELGSLPADERGKARVKKRIAALRPNVERIRREAELPPMILGPTRNGVPAEQVHNAYWAVQDLGRHEYRAVAENLAAGLEVLATRLRQMAEPRLLVTFSGGIDERMYLEGYERMGPGTGLAYGSVGSERIMPPIRYRFEAPLAALAASGAVTAFINSDGDASVGRNTVHHLAEATGGFLFEDPNRERLGERLAEAVSARYELGLYADQVPGDLERGRIELVSLRPGVKLYAAGRFATGKAYRSLGPEERRYLIVDLVHRGLEGRPQAAVQSGLLHSLAGQVLGKAAGDRSLLFSAPWPAEAKADALEVYSVVLSLHRGSQEAEVLRFEREVRQASPAPWKLEAAMPEDGAWLWGIVAIDPSSGETWYRRLMLEAPLAQASPPSASR